MVYYSLSLHDALPISAGAGPGGELGSRGSMADLPDVGLKMGAGLDEHVHDGALHEVVLVAQGRADPAVEQDRKSTRLNSSHVKISYAVFCLKNKKNNT